jgi:hypothetical protein
MGRVVESSKGSIRISIRKDLAQYRSPKVLRFGHLPFRQFFAMVTVWRK